MREIAPFTGEACRWLARHTGIAAPDLHFEALAGATSSSLFTVSDAAALPSRRFVLRVLNNPTWLAEEPDLAAHEAAALAQAHAAGLPAPEPIAHAGAEAGFSVPVVLMTHLPGAIQLRPRRPASWLRALASVLATVHRHPAPDFPWRFESWVRREALAVPPWTALPAVWERAIEIVLGPAPGARPVFLHRDFHPVNVLWQGERLTGIVDWINACRGPAGADVAHCRCNLAVMYGPHVADSFLAAYREVAEGFEYHPYWDIDDVLNMFLPVPEFYRPWQEFGLDHQSPGARQFRVDAFLQSVVRRADAAGL